MTEDRKTSLISKLGPGWFDILKTEFDEEYMINLGRWIAERRKEVFVYPEAEDLFKAFKQADFEEVRVIFLSQDPYYSPNTASGIAFASKDPFYTPPSLANIFKEVEDDIYNGLKLTQDVSLESWTDQGIFLLNTILTVEKGSPLSHKAKGWERFTAKAIEALYLVERPLVWILLGKKAQDHYDLVTKSIPFDNPKHLVLRAAHPAAESYNTNAGFFGSKVFSRTNEFLKNNSQSQILW